MRRGIVYVGGGSRHFLDQSAAVVADRIARCLLQKLRPNEALSYRINVEAGVRLLSSDIELDIATIEIAKGEEWKPVIDILEVNYLSHFTQRFEALPPIMRALKAISLMARSLEKGIRRKWALFLSEKSDRSSETFPSQDRAQASWMSAVTVGVIGSVIYWLVTGLAILFAMPTFHLSDLFSFVSGEAGQVGGKGADLGKSALLIAVLLILAESFRKAAVAPWDRWATESFASMEYQLDERRFLAIPNAILDAIEFASQRRYSGVDLLSFSLGTIWATDTIFPRRERPCTWSPRRTVHNWITIGFPYDFIVWSNPGYFSMRAQPTVEVHRWINIVVQDDFIGTDFTRGEKRGITVQGFEEARTPDINPSPLRPPRQVSASWQDYIHPLRRTLNHRIYWDDEDARAPTCFTEVLDAVEWDEEVRALLQ